MALTNAPQSGNLRAMTIGYRPDGTPIQGNLSPTQVQWLQDLMKQLKIPTTTDPMTGEPTYINLDMLRFITEQMRQDQDFERRLLETDRDHWQRVTEFNKNFDMQREEFFNNPRNQIQRYGASNANMQAVNSAIQGDYARRGMSGLLNPQELRDGTAERFGVPQPNYPGQGYPGYQINPMTGERVEHAPNFAGYPTQVTPNYSYYDPMTGTNVNKPPGAPQPISQPGPTLSTGMPSSAPQPQAPAQAPQGGASVMSQTSSPMGVMGAVSPQPQAGMQQMSAPQSEQISPDVAQPVMPSPPPGQQPRPNQPGPGGITDPVPGMPSPQPVMPQPNPGGPPRGAPPEVLNGDYHPNFWAGIDNWDQARQMLHMIRRNHPGLVNMSDTDILSHVSQNHQGGQFKDYLNTMKQKGIGPKYWYGNEGGTPPHVFKEMTPGQYQGYDRYELDPNEFKTKDDIAAWEQQNGLEWVGHEGLPPGMTWSEAVRRGIVNPQDRPTASYYKPRADARTNQNTNPWFFDGTFSNDVLNKVPKSNEIGGILDPSRVQDLQGGQARIGAASQQDLNRLSLGGQQELGGFVSKSGEDPNDFFSRSNRLGIGSQGNLSRRFMNPRSLL